MKHSDGGFTFPNFDRSLQNYVTGVYGGMSLRDYFAGQALAGSMADRAFWEWITSECIKGGRGSMHELAAKTAYAFADAMLKQRGTEE